jgi:DeoR/GlpR family transcriptional regulator of sugar metabolism
VLTIGLERREEILDLLRNNPTETYETLAVIFNCTEQTIYRDIKRLEVSGRFRSIGVKSTGQWEVTEEKNGLSVK